MIIEDFYPLNERYAYFVSGEKYAKLSKMYRCTYKIEDKKIIIIEKEGIMNGLHLRMGNQFGDLFVCSDMRIILINNIPIRRGEQPYLFEEGILYKWGWSIWLNDTQLIDLWDDKEEIGRPSYDNRWVYFEVRRRPAPQGWEIWRYNLDTTMKEKLIDGANPFVLNGKLFYSKWVETDMLSSGHFETMVEDLNELVGR